jgi:transposase
MAKKKTSSKKQSSKSGSTRKTRAPVHFRLKGGEPYPYEFRLMTIREMVDRGVEATALSSAFGVSTSTLALWLERWREGGDEALRPRPRNFADQRQRTSAEKAKREAVVRAKRAHPEHGTRRLRDELERFEGIGVSEALVRRILHEEGLIEDKSFKGTSGRPPLRAEGVDRIHITRLSVRPC